MTPIITICGLTHHYGKGEGTIALDGIDLAIEEGEILGLLGPNGAGKTTLIAVLCGLFSPTSGDAIVAGHSVVEDPMAVKRIVGVVPQEIALYPQLTARQNLRFFGQLYDLRGRALDRAVEEALDIVDLNDRADDKVASYSGGMKRRVNVSVGLLARPQIILLDEPTVGLDPESRRRILDLVRRLKTQRGYTVLLATHRTEEARELCDRVAIIHRGKIIALDGPEELVAALPMENTLRLDVDASDIPASLVKALRHVDGVSSVAPQDRAIILSLKRPHAVLPDLLRLAERAGVVVRSLAIRQPNLEDAFLHLTGVHLRAPSS